MIKRVSPLKSTILADFQASIKAGRFRRGELPRYKHMVLKRSMHKSDVLAAAETNCDPKDFRKELLSKQFYENPYFSDVYKVMR